MMKSFILQAGTRKENPVELLSYLNDNIRAYAGGNFITAFYCICDLSNRTLTYCNAGHHPPILLENDNIIFLDQAKSIPLGIMDMDDLTAKGKAFMNCEVKLASSGRLILYTDGISEIQKEDEGECYYGDEEMFVFIKRNADKKPSEFVDNLLKHARAFQGKDSFDDDICVICFDL
jgi:sigma-B regulation protein RsbU (phosphoserine phosphatase)